MTAKEQVLQVCPNASCMSYYKSSNYFVRADKTIIGMGTSPQKAWQNALSNIQSKTT